MVTVAAAPGVLHHPLRGLALGGEVNGHERHGVARGRGEGGDAFGLRHREVGLEERGVVVVAQREHARLGVEELAHVAREVHHRGVLDRGDGHGLDFLHRQVDVRPLRAVVRVSVHVDGVGLVVGTGRVVHHHHEGVLQVLAHILFVEGEGRVLLRAHGLALGVLHRPGELLHGFAEAGGEDAVDRGEHFRLAFLQGGGLLAGSHGLAQREAVFAELELQDGSHARGVVRVEALGHHLGGHEAVFAHHVDDAAEGAAVRERVLEQPLHELVVHGLRGVVDHGLKEKVGLLQLVVEEAVALRELEFAEVVVLNHLRAHHVEAREEPAAARALLVGDALRGYLVREVGVGRVGVVGVRGELVDGGAGEGVAQRRRRGVRGVGPADFLEHFGRNASLAHTLRAKQRSGCGEQDGKENLFHRVYV